MGLNAKTTNNFLATLAGVMNRTSISSAETFDAVVQQTAEEIASADDSVSAKDLFDVVPQGWRDDPDSHGTKSEVQAFLKVANTVLNVDVAALSPVVSRGLQRAKDSQLLFAINRANIASSDTPAQQKVLDFSVGNGREVLEAMKALADDAAFIERVGGQRYARNTQHLLKDELAFATAAAVPTDKPRAEVYAGGVLVQQPGPDGHPLPGKAWVSIAKGKSPMGAGRLGEVLIELAAIRNSLDEQDLRSAIVGREVGIVSGRLPPRETFRIGVRRSDEGLEIGFAIDDEALNDFMKSDDPDASAARVGDLLKRGWGISSKFKEFGIPAQYGFSNFDLALSYMASKSD